MKGRHHIKRRFSLQPSFMKDESDEDKSPKPPRRRPDRSLDRDTTEAKSVKQKVVVLGAPRTGKTAIINQFLHNTFTPRYKRTIEEMYHGEFEVGGSHLSLQILDTSGENEFPAMRNLSISNGDAFILVYDITDQSTFEVIRDIRDQIHETKESQTVPMVVVANKIDLVGTQREMVHSANESVVTVDWENGFVEASAKENTNIAEIFKELLHQAKINYNLSPALRRRRRQSLPPSDGGGGAGPSGSSAGSSSRGAGSSSSSHSHRQKHHKEKQSGSGRSSCMLS